MNEKYCHGVQLTGRRRGAPCQGRPVYEVRGKPYCVPHTAIASKAPHLFREAMETAVRRRVRQEAMEHFRGAQIDALPTVKAIEKAQSYVV